MIGVSFDPIKHKYVSTKTQREFISATKLIHSYAQEFPREFWGFFKALERVTLKNNGYNGPNLIRAYKGKKWYKERDPKGAEQFISSLRDCDEILKTKQIIFSEWDAKNKAACDKGTEYHNMKEAETIENKVVKVEAINQETGECCNQDLEVVPFHMELDLDNLEEAFYPELRLYLEEEEISGTSDCVYIVSNRGVIIEDYKTNEKLDFENKHQKMKFPVNHLDDCNWNHYRLQLSLYMYMLERRGYNPIDLAIIYKEERLNFEYLKEEIEAILKHHVETKLGKQGKDKVETVEEPKKEGSDPFQFTGLFY